MGMFPCVPNVCGGAADRTRAFPKWLLDHALGMSKHQRVTATDHWQQRELVCTSPEQRAYALIRPVVVCGVPPKERAQHTGTCSGYFAHPF